MHDRLERIESIKAGSLCGIAGGIGYCLLLTVARFVWLESARSIISIGLECALAIISGFLFGVTYRYIIRIDRNDHLNTGAVLAFGLVRGLAQVNVGEFELSQFWTDGLVLAKSILLFSIARYAIDYALAQGWVLPYRQILSIDDSNHELEREFATNLTDALKK
jgi:hypothetical protein